MSSTAFFVDVIGVIDFVQGKTLFKKENEERSHVKFEITNGRLVYSIFPLYSIYSKSIHVSLIWTITVRVNLKVTFFGNLGDEFQSRRKEIGVDPIVITICCVKVNEWDGITDFIYFS